MSLSLLLWQETIYSVFRKGKLQDCFLMSVQMIKLLEKAVIPAPHRSLILFNKTHHSLVSINSFSKYDLFRNYEMAGLGLLSCLWALHGNKGEDAQARRK